MKTYREIVDSDSGLAFLKGQESFGNHERAAIILPGAQCDANRYVWLLRALTKNDIACLAIDPPLVQRNSIDSPKVSAPTRLVAIFELALAVQVLAKSGAREIFVIGHSYGGTVLLDALDPGEAKRNPMHGLSDSFAGIGGIAGGVTLGASLQPDILGLSRPWRHAERRLYRPSHTRLLMIAASCDGLVSPEAVRATAERYSPPAPYALIDGGTHFGWTENDGPHDWKEYDGLPKISRHDQQSATAELCCNLIFGMRNTT